MNILDSDKPRWSIRHSFWGLYDEGFIASNYLLKHFQHHEPRARHQGQITKT